MTKITITRASGKKEVVEGGGQTTTPTRSRSSGSRSSSNTSNNNTWQYAGKSASGTPIYLNTNTGQRIATNNQTDLGSSAVVKGGGAALPEAKAEAFSKDAKTITVTTKEGKQVSRTFDKDIVQDKTIKEATPTRNIRKEAVKKALQSDAIIMGGRARAVSNQPITNDLIRKAAFSDSIIRAGLATPVKTTTTKKPPRQIFSEVPKQKPAQKLSIVAEKLEFRGEKLISESKTTGSFKTTSKAFAFKAGAFGVAAVSVPVGLVTDPIGSVKGTATGIKNLIFHPQKTGSALGKRLIKQPVVSSGEITGSFGTGAGVKGIFKGLGAARIKTGTKLNIKVSGAETKRITTPTQTVDITKINTIAIIGKQKFKGVGSIVQKTKDVLSVNKKTTSIIKGRGAVSISNNKGKILSQAKVQESGLTFRDGDVSKTILLSKTTTPKSTIKSLDLFKTKFSSDSQISGGIRVNNVNQLKRLSGKDVSEVFASRSVKVFEATKGTTQQSIFKTGTISSVGKKQASQFNKIFKQTFKKTKGKAKGTVNEFEQSSGGSTFKKQFVAQQAVVAPTKSLTTQITKGFKNIQSGIIKSKNIRLSQQAKTIGRVSSSLGATKQLPKSVTKSFSSNKVKQQSKAITKPASSFKRATLDKQLNKPSSIQKTPLKQSVGAAVLSFQRSRTPTKSLTSSKLLSSQASSFKTSSRLPTPTPPIIKTPSLLPTPKANIVFGVSSSSKKKNKLSKSRRAYTPSLTSASFGIVGTPSKSGVITGLGIRPIKRRLL